MTSVAKQRFGPVESCVDYQSYVLSIDPGLTTTEYSGISQRLSSLGKADAQRMGVIYVRGPWGFFVIPCHGYPTLRVSFFHDTPRAEIDSVLALICTAFESPDTINYQGALDE